MSRPNRKLAAIVFTDIVGFTELSGKNEPAALKLLEKQREIIKPIVDKYNGEWLKEIGDGLLLAFETIHDAVECSITIQGSTKAISDLDLRIGIHQGEVVYQNDDVVGDDVNVASRIEPFAAPGGIAITGRVNTSIQRDPAFKTQYICKPILKGVSQRIEAYCIVSHQLPATDLSKIEGKFELENKKSFSINSLFYVLIPLIGLGYYFYSETQSKDINDSEIVQSESVGIKTEKIPEQNINDESVTFDDQKKIENSDVKISSDIKSKEYLIPIYRFYHNKNKDHFYTQNKSPKGDWTFQRIEFYAYQYFIQGSVPIYRFYHKKNKDHFYTKKKNPKGDWTPQGTEFYAFKDSVENTVPIYRFYHKKNKDHFYTKSKSPKGNWTFQRIEFYAYPNPP
tara:strand:- start:159 stop:1346 length:1188 start_codon:yes stop_codon:yes gene_type:complete